MEKLINSRTVSRNLKRGRIEAGLTVANVAERLGVSRQTVYNWERTPDTITLEKWRKLAALYQKPLNYFFGV